MPPLNVVRPVKKYLRHLVPNRGRTRDNFWQHDFRSEGQAQYLNNAVNSETKRLENLRRRNVVFVAKRKNCGANLGRVANRSSIGLSDVAGVKPLRPGVVARREFMVDLGMIFRCNLLTGKRKSMPVSTVLRRGSVGQRVKGVTKRSTLAGHGDWPGKDCQHGRMRMDTGSVRNPSDWQDPHRRGRKNRCGLC